ncbi:hypothetical protein [Paenibacillus chitinolyticus]|uniref:hypothetical protein n=1 Tax=Paenibacillus chitinolyticus TaxID=79263 RepID=UPI001C461CED|nr:hypothetical protein [Paenibacillus chitinolyticus]MBV6717179.1 hypothetical protein [Paenibacillus chitinolyticus]
MAAKKWVIYRQTSRTEILVIGSFTNNGAKRAKVTVYRDYLGKLNKGDAIKVPIDLNTLALPVNPKYVETWTNGDPETIRRFMRKKHNEAIQSKIGYLIQRCSMSERSAQNKSEEVSR